jgi:hypothetical protein
VFYQIAGEGAWPFAPRLILHHAIIEFVIQQAAHATAADDTRAISLLHRIPPGSAFCVDCNKAKTFLFAMHSDVSLVGRSSLSFDCASASAVMASTLRIASTA